ELEADAAAWLAEEAVAETNRRTGRTVLMCYEGQGSELSVPWAGTLAATEAAFATAHKRLYGFNLTSPVRLVTVRVDAAGILDAPARSMLPRGQGAKPAGHSEIHLETGARQAAIYDRTAMGAGDWFNGPAIVTQLDATTLVPPGWRGTMHETGMLVLRRGEGG
ncbi:MAG TPA: hydantoinase/oxoprolinase family protein, partial [Rhodopila sp.]|nr:hydantoinase/oxoprolinase family protein [Rhodopila sp.]